MKKILCILIATLMIVMCATTVSANYEKCYVTASKLNCRTEPNMNGSVIKTFPNGTELQIIGAEGKWWQVYDGAIQGWCYSTYLKTENTNTSNNSTGTIGKYLGNFRVSYYTCASSENGGWNVTAKGQKLSDVVGICIAADPRVIPYYSKVYIEGIGYRTVLDCGGAIKGNKIDVLVRNNSDIPNCGVHYSNVYLVE